MCLYSLQPATSSSQYCWFISYISKIDFDQAIKNEQLCHYSTLLIKYTYHESFFFLYHMKIHSNGQVVSLTHNLVSKFEMPF